MAEAVVFFLPKNKKMERENDKDTKTIDEAI